MSKKDKSKFKRRLRAEILKEMQNVKVDKPVTTSSPTAIAEPIASAKIETAEPAKKPTYDVGLQVGASVETAQLVRADLRKSAIIIGSMILFIIALYFVDQKTGILLKAGNEIFKVLHIGTQ